MDEYESEYEDYRRILAGDFDEDEDIDLENIVITHNPIKYPSEIEHNIIIDRVSLSPLGNILVITDKGGNSPANRELFQNYFIVDDKGNFYGQMYTMRTRKNWEEDETTIIEFFGNVPDDAQYLKLIPYNDHGGIGHSAIEINNLPQKLRESDYGSVIVESCVITDEEVAVTYRYEGMLSASMVLIITAAEDEAPLFGSRRYTWTVPIYNRAEESYTNVFTFVNPLENAQDIVAGIELPQRDIELLENQAIIIPLR
jgi:hypothetical protein